MRGKAIMCCCWSMRIRITPAYAGKSCLRPKVERNDGDHPRLCGEKIVHLWICHSTRGSPPPMRGKERMNAEIVTSIRITPAYAGKSRQRPPAECPDRDHPRLCGEKHRIRCSTSFPMGSPPPMRGKVIIDKIDVKINRITPAYAGKRQL